MSTAGDCPYPAIRMLLVVHVIVVSALMFPDVVGREGLFRAEEGGARVNEADEFHQFRFSVGFCAEVYDWVVVADWAWIWDSNVYEKVHEDIESETRLGSFPSGLKEVEKVESDPPIVPDVVWLEVCPFVLNSPALLLDQTTL